MMKKCPFCLTEIPDAAQKCQHCGEWVNAEKQTRIEMVCPQCGKVYDTTWKQCINCNTALIEKEGEWIELSPMIGRKPGSKESIICKQCGRYMHKDSKPENEGMGCLLIVIGLVLCPFIIGIPVLIVGIVQFCKKQGLWVCEKCGCQIERKG